MNRPRKVCILYAIADRRTSPWDGETMRAAVGVSGSEQTCVAFAEHAAARGHDVTFVGPRCAESVARGVRYTSCLSSTEGIDVLYTCSFCDSGAVFPGLRTLIVCFQCVGPGPRRLVGNHPAAEKWAVYPSEWARRAVGTVFPDAPGRYDHHRVIHNPLFDDCIKPPAPKRPGSFAFVATQERGGEVALRVFKRGGFSEFHVLDYYQDRPTHTHVVDGNVVVHGSRGKNGVHEVLSAAEYFVYPLVLPDGRVHKDTFACCVAEALAHGVIVLTWDVAALRELYGDAAVFVPLPEGADVRALASYDFVSDNSLNGQAAVDAFSKELRRIESDPALKAELSRKGREHALARFSGRQVCPAYDDMLAARPETQ